MVRSIPESEYLAIAQKAKKPLSPENNKILLENSTHYVIANRYPYIEFFEAKVVLHLLVCDFHAKNDLDQYAPQEICDKAEMIVLLKEKYKKIYPLNQYIYVDFAKHSGKSVKQFHTHFLILESD